MTHDLEKVGTIFGSRWENVIIATSPDATVSSNLKGGQINNVYMFSTRSVPQQHLNPEKRPIPLVRGKSAECCRISVQECPSVFGESYCGLTTRLTPVYVVSLTLGQLVLMIPRRPPQIRSRWRPTQVIEQADKCRTICTTLQTTSRLRITHIFEPAYTTIDWR